MADGSITIDVLASTDKFDKQISDLEKKMKKEEDKKILLEAKLDTQEQDLERARAKTDELGDAYQRLSELKQKANKTPLEFSEMQGLQNEYGTIEKIGNSFDKALSKQEALEQKVAQTKLQYDGINAKVTDYKTKIEGIKLEKHRADIQNVSNGFKNVSSSIEDAVKRAAKLALGIFSIRRAYMFLRSASSDLASYDDQYAANLEYIKFVLTQAIAPILKWIINLARTLLTYIYAILNAWFGIGSKLDVSAEAFNKMKKNAGGVSKAVKEIKKELVGFDEITRLTDQSDTGTATGAGGVGMPDFDVSEVGELPKWVKWIMDNKTLILSVLGAIAAAIAAIKIVKFLSNLKNVFSVLKGISALKLAGMIAGVVIAIQGIIEFVPALINFIKNPSWKNFQKVLSGLEKILIGVGIAMIAFNATNPVGWIILATGAVLALVNALTKNRAEILSTKEAQEQLNEATKKAKEANDAYINAIDNAEQAHEELINIENKNKISGEELYKAVQNGTLDYKNMTEAQRETYKAYLNNKSAQEQLKNATVELTTATKQETGASLENELAIASETERYDTFKKSVVEAYNSGKISAGEARDYIERATSEMSEDYKKTFVQDLPADIAEGLDVNRYNSLLDRFTRMWNKFINGLEKNIAINFEGFGGLIIKGGGSGGGSSSGGGRAKGGIFYPSRLPKLASGGIINLPRKRITL